MSSLSSLYFKKETIQELVDVLNKKGENGVEITVSIWDESNQYGQNISAYVSQTKEQREAKKDKYYVANGRVFLTDGKIVKGEKPSDNPTPPVSETSDSDTLPF